MGLAPAWGAADSSDDAPFVGRFAELAELVDAVKEARQGNAGTALIDGDPGTGKTRLLGELQVQAGRLGARVLAGRAREVERAVPYSLVADALESSLLALDDDTLATLAGEAPASWLGVLFASAPGPSSYVPEARAHVHAVLARLLVAWSNQQPIVLMLDDLHWADRASLELIAVLARRLRGSRCLLVLAYRGRPPELDVETAAFLDELDREPGTIHCRLGSLDEQDCRALVAGLVDGVPDDSLVGLVHDVSGGNPFFIVETVRSLRDVQAIESGTANVGLRGRRVPTGLRARNAVYHRVFALGQEATAVARAVSALGSVDLARPEYDSLADVTGLAGPEIDRALDDLAKAGILAVRGGSVFEFAHPILQSLVYDDIGVAERRRIHHTIATSLRRAGDEGRRVTMAELALHVAEASPAGDRTAIELVAAAGDETLSRAPAVAAGWYERAAALVPESDREGRARILVRRARALFLADALTDALALARQARDDLPPGADREAAWSVAVGALASIGRLGEALEEVDRALAEAPDGGSPHLLAQRMSVLVYLGRVVEAEACGRQALERAGDDLPTRVRTLRQLAQIAFVRGRLAEQRRLHEEAMKAADDLPATTQGSVLAFGGVCLLSAGGLHDGREMLERAAELLGDAGAVVYRPLLDAGWAIIELLNGEWDRAVQRCLSLVPDVAASGRLVETVGTWTTLITITVNRGEIAQARRYLHEVLNGLQRSGNQLIPDYLVCCRARLERFVGRPDIAVEMLEGAFLGRDETTMAPPPVGPAELVESLAALGRTDEARAWLARLETLADDVDTPYVRALADRSRLIALGDAEAGRRSRELFAELGMPFELAQTELALGCATDDVSLLLSAHRMFEELSADPLRRRAAAEIKARGEPVPRRRRRRDVPGLSELEVQMAKLVAEGLSNREIAGVLSLSHRTVETYLSRLYIKVGCTSRAQLASLVATGRLGVVGA